MGILASHIVKNFGEPPTRVLRDLTFEIASGDFLALTGKSGSGKSTLLYILSSLDKPTSGQVEIDGHQLSRFSQRDLNEFRNRRMGFIFQSHYLIAELTALENVMLPAKRFEPRKSHHERAQFLLEECGLGRLGHRFPRHLSGGEQQRVAIARALMMNPSYLFADEPTGSLDTANGELVMSLIKKANRDYKTTVIMVTHDPDFASQAGRRIHLVDGALGTGSAG